MLPGYEPQPGNAHRRRQNRHDGTVSSQSSAPLPTVTIVLSTFDGAPYLEAQLETIAAQTYADWVLHISDDGSRDDSIAIAERWAAKDTRVRIYQTNGGQGPAAAYLRLLGTVETSAHFLCVWLCMRYISTR